MDWHIIFAIIAGVLSIASVVPYLYSMLKGTTRPNVISWSLWFFIQAIFVAAQWSSGASYSIVLPLAGVIAVSLVVILGLFGYGYKKYGPIDFVCLILVVGSIILWKLTNDPSVALWLSVAADFIAAIPTCIKSYKDPASESSLAYLIAIFASVATIFSTTLYDFPNLAWPVYIIFTNSLIVSLILLGRKTKSRAI
jgi:hypothetical protein